MINNTLDSLKQAYANLCVVNELEVNNDLTKEEIKTIKDKAYARVEERDIESQASWLKELVKNEREGLV